MGFGIIITNPIYSTGSHNIIIVLVKFSVESHAYNRYVGRK